MMIVTAEHGGKVSEVSHMAYDAQHHRFAGFAISF